MNQCSHDYVIMFDIMVLSASHRNRRPYRQTWNRQTGYNVTGTSCIYSTNYSEIILNITLPQLRVQGLVDSIKKE